jgi:GAF domain-containing protein
MTDEQPIDLTDAFALLGRIRLNETDLDRLFKEVACLAQRSIPGAAEVSVTLLRTEGAYTAAFTGDVALALDESQYQLGRGPCLAAASSGTTQLVADMATEDRWPDWTGRAREAGTHSSLSIGFPVQEAVTGALNLYATTPGAFDDDVVATAQTFARYAAVALTNAYLYDAKANLVHNMEAAMATRAVIEQAKGIIMGERRCTAEDAFAILAKVSQGSNVKVRDVAAALVARATTGEPEPWRARPAPSGAP